MEQCIATLFHIKWSHRCACSALFWLTSSIAILREQKLAVGGGPLDELQRLTVCSADPTAPHQSGTSAAIPVHRRVGRELVRDNDRMWSLPISAVAAIIYESIHSGAVKGSVDMQLECIHAGARCCLTPIPP